MFAWLTTTMLNKSTVIIATFALLCSELRMPFTRVCDSTCPQVYDSWEAHGKQWLIQDLAPEDDEAALELLKNHFLPDEKLCALTRLIENEQSLESILKCWRLCLTQRMSLGCYEVVHGQKTLVALNVCIADNVEERFPNVQIEGDAWKQVYGAILYIEKKCDPFKYFGLDNLLHALGLVVKKEYRGMKLGSRILKAREPLCRSQGIQATATVFSGDASQKSAARAGFHTICTVTLKELAESGLQFPSDENSFLKLMVKRYE